MTILKLQLGSPPVAIASFIDLASPLLPDLIMIFLLPLLRPYAFIYMFLYALLLASTTKGAPYVGSAEALGRFDDITTEQMNELRTKKILFASRSFGLNLRDGLNALPSQYNILNAWVLHDVYRSGGDLSIIPANDFENYNFVHFLASYWPHSLRINETERLLREAPWNFSSKVDVVIIYFHYALPSMFNSYTERMDAMQADFPHIKFIYVCAGYMDGTIKPSENQSSFEFNELIKARYRGVAPLYDLAAILSKDEEAAKSIHPDYTNDPAGVHPNTPAGEEAMAKGFLVMLKELFFATEETPFDPPTGVTVSTPSESTLDITWTAPTIPEGSIGFYRILRGGKLVGTSAVTSFTDTGLTENTFYDYRIVAVSSSGIHSEESAAASGQTLSDHTPPSLVQAFDTEEATRVVLEFSEPLEAASASNPANYKINGLTVISALLNGRNLTLTTSEMTANTIYTVTVSGLLDNASSPNQMAGEEQTSYRFTPPEIPIPVAHWSFDGNLLDDMGSSASWKDGSDAYTNGFIGKGLTSNGTSTGPYVLIADNTAHDGGSGLTVSVWAKKAHADIGGWLLKKHLAFDLNIINDDIKGYLFNQTGAQTAFSVNVPAINDTLWHHYCMTYNGSILTLSVDGLVVKEIAMTGPVANSSQGIYMGKEPWGNALTFAGEIDELTLFNQAADPNILYQAGKDHVAVASLLTANGAGRTVESVAVKNASGRIIELYIQEGGIHEITADIGQLTELRILHCYGDRNLGYDLLTRVDPAIANCTNLEELLINQNDLHQLPPEIINLTRLTVCSAGDNYLAEVEGPVLSWLNHYDPDWLSTQVNYTLPTPQTWEAFRIEHFNSTQLKDPDISGKYADPDFDHRNNFLEYFLQSNPLDPLDFGDMVSLLSNGTLIYQLTGLNELSGLTLQWMQSTDLQSLSPVIPNTISILEDHGTTQKMEFRFDIPNNTPVFFQLEISP